MDRSVWMRRAELFDTWRVIPRALLTFYCVWSVYLIDKIVSWYVHLTLDQQTLQNAGMVSAVITAVTGFGVPIFRIYTENGRDWNALPPPRDIPTVNPP